MKIALKTWHDELHFYYQQSIDEKVDHAIYVLNKAIEKNFLSALSNEQLLKMAEVVNNEVNERTGTK